MLRSFKGNEFSYLFNYAMEVSIKWSFCIFSQNQPYNVESLGR